MDTLRTLNGNVVNLVTYGPVLNMTSIPNVGDYGHWNIRSMTPCVKKNGKYVDIRTNAVVPDPTNKQEWPLLVGAVIQYSDGKKFLLSRSISGDRPLLLMKIDDAEFNPASMYTVKLRNRKMK